MEVEGAALMRNMDSGRGREMARSTRSSSTVADMSNMGIGMDRNNEIGSTSAEQGPTQPRQNSRTRTSQSPQPECAPAPDYRARRLKANENERRRMMAINLGYEHLMAAFPRNIEISSKPSKAEILECAARSIDSLTVQVKTLTAQLEQKNSDFEKLQQHLRPSNFQDPLKMLAETATILLPALTPHTSSATKGINATNMAAGLFSGFRYPVEGSESDDDDSDNDGLKNLKFENTSTAITATATTASADATGTTLTDKASASFNSDSMKKSPGADSNSIPFKKRKIGENNSQKSSDSDDNSGSEKGLNIPVVLTVPNCESCHPNEVELTYLRKRVGVLEFRLKNEEKIQRKKFEKRLRKERGSIIHEEAFKPGTSSDIQRRGRKGHEKPVSYSAVLTEEIIKQVPKNYGISKESLATIIRAIQHVEDEGPRQSSRKGISFSSPYSEPDTKALPVSQCLR